MKKILSIILMMVMLVGCLVTALSVSAADLSISADTITVKQGADTTVAPALKVAGNPGISYAKFVVYYNSAELAQADATNAFANAIVGADSVVNGEVAGTQSSIRNYIPTEERSTSKGFIVEIFGELNEETEETDPIVGDGILVNLPLEIIGSEYKVYNYTVVIAEAYDAEGEDLTLDNVTGTINYEADALIGKYDEFTIFADPASAEIDLASENKTVSVDVRFDQNPGVWSARLFIVYPKALSLAKADGSLNATNTGRIFPVGSEEWSVADKSLSDPNLMQELKNIVAANNIDSENYHFVAIYCQLDDPNGYVDANGVFANLVFTATDKITSDQSYDIRFYYDPSGDFIKATDEVDEDGLPVFNVYTPATVGADINTVCAHTTTRTETQDKTCLTNGYVKTFCTICNALVDEETIPAPGEHTTLQPGNTFTQSPTCTEDGYTRRVCDVCGEEASYETLPQWGHDEDGEQVITKTPTCKETGILEIHCDLCGEVSKTETLPVDSDNHDFADATCTAPKTCKACGATEGAKLGHKYDNACDKSCNRCGATRTITHSYAAATCTKAKTCKVCKATTGTALGHSYKTTTTKATLTKNGSIVKKCTRCATVASNTAIKYAKTFTLSATSYTFDGKVKTPTVTVKDTAGKKLVKGTDYTVTYAAGRKNAGTYKVTITMIGKYSGTKVLTFKINPVNISKCTIKLGATSYVYNGKVKTPAVTVKNASGTTLVKGTAYTVTYAAGRTNVGTYKVTITMKGNYTGTKTLTFKINPAAISLTKLTAGNKSFTAAWAPKTTVTGYEIQYSTAKNFSGAKTVTMASKSTKTKTVKSLANGKKYYVRIRVYKTVNGVKLYSAWSAAKYVTPKAK